MSWRGSSPRGLRTTTVSVWEQWDGQASFRLLSFLECSIKNEAADLGWVGGKGCLPSSSHGEELG